MRLKILTAPKTSLSIQRPTRAPAGTWNCRSPATLSAMGRTLWPRFRRSWKPRCGSTPAGTRRPIALKRPTCMFSKLPCVPTDIPPASWPNTFCRCWTRWPPYAAGMNFGYWVLRILRRCIPRNGPTLCVKRGAALTCSASALLTAGGLSGWPALRPTARRCGRSGLTCCRVTGARVSRLR